MTKTNKTKQAAIKQLEQDFLFWSNASEREDFKLPNMTREEALIKIKGKIEGLGLAIAYLRVGV